MKVTINNRVYEGSVDEIKEIVEFEMSRSNDMDVKPSIVIKTPSRVNDMDVKPSSCDHDWIDLIFPTYPPKYGRQCRKCGMVMLVSRNP